MFSLWKGVILNLIILLRNAANVELMQEHANMLG